MKSKELSDNISYISSVIMDEVENLNTLLDNPITKLKKRPWRYSPSVPASYLFMIEYLDILKEQDPCIIKI